MIKFILKFIVSLTNNFNKRNCLSMKAHIYKDIGELLKERRKQMVTAFPKLETSFLIRRGTDSTLFCGRTYASVWKDTSSLWLSGSSDAKAPNKWQTLANKKGRELWKTKGSKMWERGAEHDEEEQHRHLCLWLWYRKILVCMRILVTDKMIIKVSNLFLRLKRIDVDSLTVSTCDASFMWLIFWCAFYGVVVYLGFF